VKNGRLRSGSAGVRRRATVKNRGSERRKGTWVRSTVLPFARRAEGEPRGTRSGDASPGNRLPRCPTRVPASDSEQASRASCRSLVESGRPVERELDSQPGNRRSAARRPSLAKRRCSHAACGETGRSRVCSIFTLVAEADGRFPACRGPRRLKALRSRNAGTVHAVRQEAARRERQRKAGSRAETEQQAGSPRHSAIRSE
jgi:hypothetical protein